jgi:hypothetical protein
VASGIHASASKNHSPVHGIHSPAHSGWIKDRLAEMKSWRASRMVEGHVWRHDQHGRVDRQNPIYIPNDHQERRQGI